MECGCKNKKCDKERVLAVGMSEEWMKIPGVKGAQWAKVAKMMLRKNWTECDKGRDNDS